LSLEFGVHLPIHGTYGYQDTLEVSIAADDLGYHSLWVGDHFYLPRESYIIMGGDPNRQDKLDAWTTLAAIATQTRNIKLGTRVSPIPFYLPARLAKMVTTVDIISKGRVFLGVGAGWHKEEAVTYGVGWGNHQERISKMLEGLEVILKLWMEDRATYKGKYYMVDNAPFWPKPIQKPHPPIWFGGSSTTIIDAAVKYGDGLLPLTDIPLEKFEELVSEVSKRAERCGRKRKLTLAPSLSYPDGVGNKPSEWLSKIEAFNKKGAGLILLDFSETKVSPGRAVEFLKDFSQTVFPACSK